MCRQQRRARSVMKEPMKNKLPSPEERLELILLGLARHVQVKDLCKQAGVSRELFYRWLRNVRIAGLKALEVKAPGPKAVPPEKAQYLAHKLTRRVEQMEKDARSLRKERDHWRLLAETAKRIIRRNAWGQVMAPLSKKNAMRSRKPANYTVKSGLPPVKTGSRPLRLPGAGALPAARTGDGLPGVSAREDEVQ